MPNASGPRWSTCSTNARQAVLARETAGDASRTSSTAPMWSCGSSGTGPTASWCRYATGAPASGRRTCTQIFEPYFTTRRSGTGLGLPIARNIVEGLGGTLAIRDGRGRHHDRYRSARTPARSRRHMTATGSILLVDDEEKILKTLGRALRAEGHRVVERSNAREARRLITDEAFDVLIVDNLMPDHDRARADPRRRHVGARGRPAADHHDDGARDRRGCHRGDEARRARLPAEALRGRSTCSSPSAGPSITSACAPSTATCSASATRSTATTASSAAAGRCRR